MNTITAPQRTATTDPSPDRDTGAPPRRYWAALAVLALGLAMIVIDGTIVSVSMPTIIADLHLDLTDAQWVTSLYAVVFSALLLTTGRLGDRFGRRRLFVVGVVLFVAGSAFAALSTSAATLIWARVVQGIGGAAVLPGTLSTVNALFTGRARAAAFGVWGAVMAGAAAVGPLLGGWLTSSFHWSWIFWVNVPVGVLVLIGALTLVPETRSGIEAPGADVDGLLLSAAGFGMLVFGLIEWTSLSWAKWLVPGALVPLLLFVAWERHRARIGRSALLDLRLFRVRTFSWGNLTALMVAVGEFGLLFVLPLFLVNVLALDVLTAGLVLAAMAAGAFVSGAAARHLAARLGAATTVILGLVLELIGVGVLAVLLTDHSSLLLIAGLLVVYGIGLGLAAAQLTSTVLSQVPADQSGQGSATQSTVRQVGSALGTAVIGAVLSQGITHQLAGVSGQAGRLAGALRDSAGNLLSRLRDQGDDPTVVQTLAAAFTDATRISMAGAAVFLALGLIGAVRVALAARAEA